MTITYIGNNRFQCLDLMLGIDQLMGNDVADFIYSDPPWGPAAIKNFATLNTKNTGQTSADTSLSSFLDNFFSVCNKFAKNKIVIEYGIKWRNDIIFYGTKHGFIHAGVTGSFYRSGLEKTSSDVHVFTKDGTGLITNEFAIKCSQLNGVKLVSMVFDEHCPKDAQIILDPCCGMGYTAQVCVDRNLTFIGNELNSKRLQKTINRFPVQLARNS